MQMAALLWDCDGVLADTERDGHRVSFNRVFSERSLGFEWGVEEYGKLCEVGGGKERMTAYFNARAGDRSFCLNSPTHPLFPICRNAFPPHVRHSFSSFFFIRRDTPRFFFSFSLFVFLHTS